MWEVRVALGPDPVSGRTRVRSVTVHGDRETAQAARERWAASAELLRPAGRARPGITLACLLREWLVADHGWRPSTVVGYRSAVGFLARDRIGSRRAIDVGPAVLAAAITAWRADGWTDPTVWARVRALRSALGVERLECCVPGSAGRRHRRGSGRGCGNNSNGANCRCGRASGGRSCRPVGSAAVRDPFHPYPLLSAGRRGDGCRFYRTKKRISRSAKSR